MSAVIDDRPVKYEPDCGVDLLRRQVKTLALFLVIFSLILALLEEKRWKH